MSTIFQCKQKLSSLIKNIKSSFQYCTDQQIKAIQNIINIMFSYAFKQNKIVDSQLFAQLNKIITKYNLKIVNGKIQFEKPSSISHCFYYAKTYCDFLNKINSYLNNFVTAPQKYNDLIVAVDDSKLNKITMNSSDVVQQNELLTAQQDNVMLKEYVLNNYKFSDINNIYFDDNEEKNLETFRTKTLVGNKHMQIAETDTTSLVDVQDTKDIIKNIEESTINKANLSTAQ